MSCDPLSATLRLLCDLCLPAVALRRQAIKPRGMSVVPNRTNSTRPENRLINKNAIRRIEKIDGLSANFEVFKQNTLRLHRARLNQLI